MSKKPAAPKKPSKVIEAPMTKVVEVRKEPAALRDNADIARINQLESELREVTKQLGQKLNEIAHLNEIIEPLQAEVQRQAGLANAAAELAHLKGLIEPFVKCAKGDGVTSPEDWDKLKGL